MKEKPKKVFSFSVEDKHFRKSSYSRIITRCVNVAKTERGVALRDTKDPMKTTLFFTKSEWTAFIKGVKKNEFD